MKIVELFKISLDELMNNFSKYSPFYFMLLFLSFLDSISEFLIPKYAENVNIIFSLLIFFSMLVVTVMFIRTQKLDSKNGDFWYLFIPFLLYTIYYSIIMLLGFILIFIPGILFYYVPIIATMGTKGATPFKSSIKMVKKNWRMAAFLSISSFLLELLPLSFKLIPNLSIRIFVDGIFSIVDCGLYLVLTLMTVKMFYIEFSNEI